jgi:hypothetical protein
MPTGVPKAIAQDNRALRERFLAEEDMLISRKAGEQTAHRDRNSYVMAIRWKKAGKLFSISHRGSEYFPAFQFKEGRPHPVIAKVLETLPRTMTPWQIAFWFVSTNGWLDGDAPRDRLDNPRNLLSAAARETDEILG